MSRDDTEKIEYTVCHYHTGHHEAIRNAKENIVDLWKAVGQIRMMFVATMLSTIGTLGMIIWAIVSNKIGL